MRIARRWHLRGMTLRPARDLGGRLQTNRPHRLYLLHWPFQQSFPGVVVAFEGGPPATLGKDFAPGGGVELRPRQIGKTVARNPMANRDCD